MAQRIEKDHDEDAAIARVIEAVRDAERFESLSAMIRLDDIRVLLDRVQREKQ